MMFLCRIWFQQNELSKLLVGMWIFKLTNLYDPLEKRSVFSRKYCIFNMGYWCNNFFVLFSVGVFLINCVLTM